jgi:sigma-B regulation protein RsbU (phosphoserine phosphatase)
MGHNVSNVGTVGNVVVHEIELDADVMSPRAARRLVAGALATCPSDVVDTALLLVTELVTNAVVHAGTNLSVRVEVADEFATVRVRDRNPGVVDFDGVIADDLGEGGRGLTLVSRLADTWGTRHARSGKEVWFCLGESTAVATPSPRRPALAPDPAAATLLDEVLVQQLTVSEELHELLERVVDLCGGRARLVNDGAVIAEVGLGVGDFTWSTPLQIGSERLGAVELVNAPASASQRAFVSLVAARVAVVLKTQRLADLQAQERGASAFLAEASELLAGTLDAPQALAMLNHLIISAMADWSAAFHSDAHGLTVASVAHVDESSTALLEARCAPGAAVSGALARAIAQRSALPATVDADSVVLLPLVARGRVLGGLAVGRRAPFTPAEIVLLEDVARRGALAYDNALLYGAQVAVATALQSTLLPPELPIDPALEVAAEYHAGSAGMDVGGDFYDIVQMNDKSWFLVIGDVCGKGAEAAAVTRVSRDVLRLLIRRGVPVVEALAELNVTLLEQGPSPRFCTLACAHLVPEAGGSFRAHIYSAGHPAPVIMRADCATESTATGTLLGVFDNDELEFSVDSVLLTAGEALVFYTDGVTESRSGTSQFGDVRMLAELREPAFSAAGIAARLQRAATEFAAGGLRDDVAVLVAMVPRR